jgi:hypothetical protein
MSDVDRVEVAVNQIRQVPEGLSLEDVVLELDSTQQAALEALIATGMQKDAAEAAGVHPNTVGRWMKTDPFFRAAYNAWLQEMRESGRARLFRLTARAISNVEKALEEGDRKLSYQVLKDLGYLEKQKDVSTDPNLVQVQLESECRQQAFEPELAEVLRRSKRRMEVRKQRRLERMASFRVPEILK